MDFSKIELLDALSKTTNLEYKDAIISYADNLLNKNLPVIFSLKHFSIIMDIDYLELLRIINNTDYYYAYYTIKKRQGGKRKIIAPFSNLKRIQTWILHKILYKIPLNAHCKGFVKGCSILDNALPHKGKQYIRKFDLKDFFESITVNRVYGIFKSIGYSPAVSHCLASLCTLEISKYKFFSLGKHQKYFQLLYNSHQRFLPQGAPTSPMLANLICRHLDGRFAKFACKHNIQYTRYADDLTFSSDDIKLLPSKAFVDKIVKEEKFQLNYNKIGTYGRESRQMVTGVLINGGKVKVPQKFKRQIYRHLHFCEKFGVHSHFNHIMPNKKHARDWLYGKIAYVYSIEPEEGKKMYLRANSLGWYKL